MSEIKKEGRGQAFFRFVMNRIENDKGRAAALRRADNQSTEYQSWEHLALFGVDLEKMEERLAFGLVAAAIVKAKINVNGSLGIGEAIAGCYDEGSRNDQAKAKLRRLLSCDSVEELCSILRPLLRLIDAKCSRSLDFARLLNEILRFKWYEQSVKSMWAKNFYGWKEDEEGGE